MRAYMRSTWERASNFDWELLGADAVKMVEEFKEETAAEAVKLQATGAKKNPTKKLKSAKGVITDPQLSPPDAVENVPAKVVEATPAYLVGTASGNTTKFTPITEVMDTKLIEKNPSSDATPDPQAS